MNSGMTCRSATWVRQGRRALFLPEAVKSNSPTYTFAMTNRVQDYRHNPAAPVSPRTQSTETKNKVQIYMPDNRR